MSRLGKFAVLAVVLAVAFFGARTRLRARSTGIADHPTSRCSVYRAAIKAGIDKDAPQIVTLPVNSDIALLATSSSLEVKNASRSGDELRVFRLTGSIQSVRLEPDGDIHVVLEDGGRTVIAEVPSLDCGAEKSRFASQITSSREYLLRHGRRLVRKQAKVTVDGVGFFDFEHQQTGKSENNFELHPVLRICSGMDCWWR